MALHSKDELFFSKHSSFLLSSLACLITKAAITEYYRITFFFFYTSSFDVDVIIYSPKKRNLFYIQKFLLQKWYYMLCFFFRRVYLLAYSRYISVHIQRKNILHFMWKLITVRAVVVSHRQTSVRLTFRWHYDTDFITAVRKANLRLFHENRNTQVRFLRASQVANGNPSPHKLIRNTYDWHVKLPYVFRCTQSLQHNFQRYDQPQESKLAKSAAHARSPNTYGQLWQRF